MKFRRLIIGVIALLLAVGACKPPTVPSTVGQPLPAAIQILEKARFKKITVVDTHGATIAKSKYNDGYLVSAQDPAGTKGYPSSTKIKLTVSETKPTPTPTPTATPTRTPTPTPESEAAPAPVPAPESESQSEENSEEAEAPAEKHSSVYYSNCTEAWNAGAAPIYRGEPGYRIDLDRDKDGVACEKRPSRRR